jgi:F-type H+-transporting ATPase subunit delta
MAELTVVRRYARALFDTAVKSNALEQVEEDLKGVDAIMRTVPTLRRALGAPTIATSRKKQLLEQAFGTRVGALTLRFMTLAVDRRRQDILREIYPEFHRLANAARNILPVQVQSAVAMTDAERDELTAALAQKTGKKIQLSVDIEPELIGGMIVRMGDTIIDGSVKSKLEQLHRKLAATLY